MRAARRWLCLAAAAAPATAQQQFFPAPALLTTSPAVVKIRAGDYDGDGAQDLYVAQVFYAPALLHNDGAGAFTNVGASLPLPQGMPRDAVFVDFDRDGDRDLLVGTSFSMQLLEYRGAGVWIDASASLPPGMPPFVGAVARDFDADGDVDVATVTHPLIGGTNRMLVNQGNGTFSATMPFANYGSTVLASDLDLDGDDDLVVGGSWPPYFELWRNDGSMVFTNVTATAPAVGSWVTPVAGDVDGDGDPDLVLTRHPAADTLLRNLGGAFVLAPGALPATAGGTYSVELVDVDGDQDLDLVRLDGAGVPQLALNDGTGAFTNAPQRLPPPPTNAAGLMVQFDEDGDADADLLLTEGFVGIHVLENRHRQLVASALPQRGTPWTVELWAQPGYGTTARAAWLAVGLGRLPAALAIAPFGRLWLDLGAPFVLLTTVVAPAAPSTPFVLPIPAVPALAGVVLHAQGLVEESPGLPHARLTAPLSAAIQ